jgi:SAM-dependent MidA family methyltransferase
LARQFAEWHQEMGLEEVTFVEAGAHDGQLARDILDVFRKAYPGRNVHYSIIEPSERRRTWQQARLDLFAGQVSWFASLEELPEQVAGVIFCNELLDSMPLHILRWNGDRWVERRVGLSKGGLTWQTGELEAGVPQPAVASELAAVLPEGYQIEACPAALKWWHRAAAKLQQGKLVAIDYGFAEDGLFPPHRKDGTVRAYYRHHLADDLLARPGEQDITAHVNFTAIRRAGEESGLRTEALVTQSKFLTEIVPKVSAWAPNQVRQIQTLTHPEHLGRPFKVLIQSR